MEDRVEAAAGVVVLGDAAGLARGAREGGAAAGPLLFGEEAEAVIAAAARGDGGVAAAAEVGAGVVFGPVVALAADHVAD
ncbi:MAG: hypothetical protein ACK559_09390, partial [bacterium]